MESETPVLCSECRQWLCAAKDYFCGYCGVQLICSGFSCDKLILNGNNTAALRISNKGRFNLYWAAEVVVLESRLSALFAVYPDYGVIHPSSEQIINLRFHPDNRGDGAVRAYLEISSNDPLSYEVKLPILTKEANVSIDTE